MSKRAFNLHHLSIRVSFVIRASSLVRERLALKNLESTTMRHFAMKIPGHLGLNKNLNRKRLWTEKNSLSHSSQRLVFFSFLDSSGTGCSCMARIRKSQRFYEANPTSRG